jgi:ABC-type Mn2+/Zn2+ transport system permease subunit
VFVGFTNGFLEPSSSSVGWPSWRTPSYSLLPGLALAAIFIGLSVGLLFGAAGGRFCRAWRAPHSRSSRVKEETAIAALYIVAFAVGIALIKYAGV